VIYRSLRAPLLSLLRIPEGPPEAPAGSHASVRVLRASPRYLAYRLLLLRLLAALMAGVCLAALLVASAQDEAMLAVGVLSFALPILCLLLLAGLLVRVDYDLRHYVITDRSLRVRAGAWTVREMTISYANVQNLRLVQGPLMRLYRIAHLQIDVAGGGVVHGKGGGQGGHHVTVAGVEDAAGLRDLILDHQRRVRSGAGLGDPEDEPARAAHGLSARALAALEGVAAAASALSASAAR
jgi:membrane protein YdbS with pleckstrin-like domain